MAEETPGRAVLIAVTRERLEAEAARCLRNIDALADQVRLGPASTVFMEYEGAPVAITRTSNGGGRLLLGAPHAAPGEVLRKVRQLSSGQLRRPVGSSLPNPAADHLRVGQALLEHAGQVATARVELVHGDRRVMATSVGRNVEERGLFLMAEAAARAVTAFLPPEYGVVLEEIHPLPEELGRVLKAAVLFLTPTEDQPLEGIASVEGDPAEAAARTVLTAVAEHVKPLLQSTAPHPSNG